MDGFIHYIDMCVSLCRLNLQFSLVISQSPPLKIHHVCWLANQPVARNPPHSFRMINDGSHGGKAQQVEAAAHEANH